jgi:hypothetical protein
MYRIRECLKATPEAARKGVFAGMLAKYIGQGALQGMEFLGAPIEVPNTIVQILAGAYTAASRASSVGGKPGTKSAGKKSGGSDKKDDLPVDSGGNGLIIGIAAIAGAYLLTKS